MADQYPNVPIAPGVPPLLRDPSAPPIPPVAPVNSNGVGSLGSSATPTWGIFLRNGKEVLKADTVVALDFKQDYAVADFPVEQGGFQSYDKVTLPFGVRVRFSRGGSEKDRQAFLATVATIAASLTLYDVVTPEVTYYDCNIAHYDYRRTAREGVGLLIVDLWLVQIRVTGTAAFSNTKSPAGASPVSGGTVQPVNATPAQAALVPAGIQ